MLLVLKFFKVKIEKCTRFSFGVCSGYVFPKAIDLELGCKYGQKAYPKIKMHLKVIFCTIKTCTLYNNLFEGRN
jgi:hypothetical protein